MHFKELKQRTYDANMAILKAGLVVLTWGNASAADRSIVEGGAFAIKPSGVPYDALTPDDMVVLSIATGKVLEDGGGKRPSSDTPTHWRIYQAFGGKEGGVGGVVHTHSTHGTAFAQALRDIPCLGTTHADNFYGPIPVTRQLTPEEIAGEYELNTGKLIAETFRTRNLDPLKTPGVLIASHAPFTWGETPEKAVENAIVLEFAAEMARQALLLNPALEPIPQPLLDKHFLRKHGPRAYYGQIPPR